MRATIIGVLFALLAAGCSSSAAPPPANQSAAPTHSAAVVTQTVASTSSAAVVTSTAGAFMGIPDEQGGDVFHASHGDIPKITPVRDAEYSDYLQLKADGKIVEEMQSGRYQYYAVRVGRDVPVAQSRPEPADERLDLHHRAVQGRDSAGPVDAQGAGARARTSAPHGTALVFTPRVTSSPAGRCNCSTASCTPGKRRP